MSIVKKLTDIVGGSLFKEVKEGIMAYFPPSMTPQERAEMELKVQELLHQKEMDIQVALQQAAAQLDKRINDQEGTARDLKTIPVIGHLIIFLRGCQRPIWGFATLWMDAKWFFGAYEFNSQQQTALIVINLLVLSFLFGERTVKNLEPIIMQVFEKGKT